MERKKVRKSIERERARHSQRETDRLPVTVVKRYGGKDGAKESEEIYRKRESETLTERDRQIACN